MEQQLSWNEIQKELDTTVLAEDLIKDNKFPFIYNKEMYLVRMPNQAEIAEARAIYNARKNKLSLVAENMFEKKLRKVLKEVQDVDIEQLEKDVETIDIQIVQIELSGNKLKDSEETAIQNLKTKKENLWNHRRELTDEIAGYLAPSIENQAKDEQYNYLAAVCTEKCVDKKENKWESVWKDFEGYKKDSSTLPYMALGALTKLLLQ